VDAETDRWFLDTEFNENGVTIEPISVGLVREDGAFVYCVSNEFDPNRCNDWVKANVLPHLPPRGAPQWMSRAEIRDAVMNALLPKHVRGRAKSSPEIWGYYADYDWVLFCQLFGRMIDLPQGMPMFCRDIRQLMDHAGVKKSDLPPQSGTLHDALEDARWNRKAYLHIQSLLRRR
jgi:hypothetical protein